MFGNQKTHLNIQLCIYPFFDGGFYFNGPHGPLNKMIRIGLGIIDFRLWIVTPLPANIWIPAEAKIVKVSNGNK